MREASGRLRPWLLGGLGLPCVVACLGTEPLPGTGADASAGGARAPATTSEGGAVGEAAGPGDAGCAPVAQTPLANAVYGPTIDDMTADRSPTGGYWYTYSARTEPNSEPSVLESDAGTLSPAEGASFPANQAPSAGGGATCVPPLSLAPSTGDGGILGYREFSGSGIPAWGAGFGMDLVSAPPDGGPVAINGCDAGAIFDTRPDAGEGATGIPQPFDASAHKGFAFWAISLTAKDLEIEVHVDDADTTPWGGVCDVCRSSGTCTGASGASGTSGASGAVAGRSCPCSDNFYETVTFAHGRWTEFAIRWADPTFTANHWSNEGALVFDPTRVYNIHFQNTIASGTTPPFDVAVAELRWLDD